MSAAETLRSRPVRSAVASCLMCVSEQQRSVCQRKRGWDGMLSEGAHPAHS